MRRHVNRNYDQKGQRLWRMVRETRDGSFFGSFARDLLEV